jgi:hypothetical protein
MHLPPVHVAIVAFGGARTLAAALGIPHQRVIEWARPYALDGHDGEFPNPVIIKRVILAARERGCATFADNDLLWGKDVPTAEVIKALPPQARAPWWNLPAPEPEPEPALPPGR